MHTFIHTYIQRSHYTRGTDSSHYPRVSTAKIFQRPAYVICRVGCWLLNCCSSVLNILLLLGFLSRPFSNRSWLCFSFRTTFRLLLWTSHLSKTRLPDRVPQLLQGPRKFARESKDCNKKKLWLQKQLLFYQTLYSNQITPQEKR